MSKRLSVSYRKSLGNQMNSAENLAHRENSLNRFVDIQRQMLLVQQNMQQNVLGLQKQMLDLQADFIKPLVEMPDLEVDESMDQTSQETSTSKASTSNPENVEIRAMSDVQSTKRLKRAMSLRPERVFSTASVPRAQKRSSFIKARSTISNVASLIAKSVPKKADKPMQIINEEDLNYELIETGRCKLPESFPRNRSVYKIAYNMVYNILTRYSIWEKPTGGAFYCMNKGIHAKANGDFTEIVSCYGANRHKCNVKLKIEYDHKESMFKLYRTGCHNHSLEHKTDKLRRNRLLQQAGLTTIEIISTKIDLTSNVSSGLSTTSAIDSSSQVKSESIETD